MPQGYRGEGIFHQAPMESDTRIEKGQVVRMDEAGVLHVAPPTCKDPIGVAAETKVSREDEQPELAYVNHGIAEVQADTGVPAGVLVRVSMQEAGQVERTRHQDDVLGRSLEPIGEGETGDIFVRGA